eukprot:4934697-Prymnesium_polylepis.1
MRPSSDESAAEERQLCTTPCASPVKSSFSGAPPMKERRCAPTARCEACLSSCGGMWAGSGACGPARGHVGRLGG